MRSGIYKMTEQHKENIRNSLKGKAHSPEWNKRISLSLIGKKLSETHKQKLSISHKGKILSREHRNKISLSNLGKKMSEEAKQKIRIGLMGNKNSLGIKRSPGVIEKLRLLTIKGQFKKGQPSVFRGKKRPNISGANHWAWNNGSSFEPYPLGWTKTFKEQIRQRDNYKCQICGIPGIGCRSKLDVHHIDYNKDNLNPLNLISLCHSCHTKTNTHHKHWINYFNQSINKYLEHTVNQ